MTDTKKWAAFTVTLVTAGCLVMAWVEGEYLCGQLRAAHALPETYHIRAEEEYFLRQGKELYRCNTILRRRVELSGR